MKLTRISITAAIIVGVQAFILSIMGIPVWASMGTYALWGMIYVTESQK